MKKRFTEEQILDFLKQAEAGVPVKELCRRHSFSDATLTRPLARSMKPGMLRTCSGNGSRDSRISRRRARVAEGIAR
ncbi:transposase, partial [Pseudomonas aeruginosa]|uniref:transposase n=1 Tax=Pseudomonas aeruginosa TaxID=287 RepID=UPI003FD36345